MKVIMLKISDELFSSLKLESKLNKRSVMRQSEWILERYIINTKHRYLIDVLDMDDMSDYEPLEQSEDIDGKTIFIDNITDTYYDTEYVEKNCYKYGDYYYTSETACNYHRSNEKND